MLEHFFGSKTRVKILKLFYKNPKRKYFVREIARQTGMQLNAVRRELENLKNVGFIADTDALNKKSAQKNTEKNEETGASSEEEKIPGYIEKLKRYYIVNQNFLLYHELRSLILKARLYTEQSFVKKIEEVSRLNMLILTGIFVGAEKSRTDMLMVGGADRKKLSKIISDFERELDSKINYTVMSDREFRYRKEITDKFLYDILENKNIIMIDRTQKVT